MKRVLCWLGFHDWRMLGEPIFIPGTLDAIAPCRCVRCGKQKVRKL